MHEFEPSISKLKILRLTNSDKSLFSKFFLLCFYRLKRKKHGEKKGEKSFGTLKWIRERVSRWKFEILQSLRRHFPWHKEVRVEKTFNLIRLIFFHRAWLYYARGWGANLLKHFLISPFYSLCDVYPLLLPSSYTPAEADRYLIYTFFGRTASAINASL